jgi:hypothetical protein
MKIPEFNFPLYMKIMLDTARCFIYILIHSTIVTERNCVSNNSFEPIRKTTLEMRRVR